MNKKPNKQTITEEALKTKLDRWWKEDSESRKRIDWQWFMYDLWKEGHHYAKYDKQQQQIVTAPENSGRPKVMINKIDSTLRAVTNYALRNRPKAEVTPYGMTEGDVDGIVDQNRFLDFMHDRLGIREKSRGAVEESLASGISWVQVLFDEDAEDASGNKGQIVINDIDKYDLYWQKNARSPEESRRFTLAVSRSIEDLKQDSKYKGADWDKVKEDKLLSSSTLKERLMRLDTGDSMTSDPQGKGNVLVKEYWYYGDEDAGEDPEKWYICATAGGEIIRKPEQLDITRSCFFRLCCSKKKLSMVGKSWIKNLIPLNRRLNALMSSLAEYNLIMNKGFWIADKGAGVRAFKNEHGVVYEKKRGFEVKQGAVNPISTIIIQEIELILRLFEDIGAVHDATLGRIPAGAKSGNAIEALQTGDSNSLSEVVEQTEIWLEEIYEYTLTLAAEKYQFARKLTPTTSTGQREFIKVIGEEAQNQPEDATVIRKKNIVDVKITSYLAHTPEARRNAIRELASIIPDLDPETILSVYEIGPIADIVKRIRENKVSRQTDELAMQDAGNKMAQPPGAGAEQAIAVIRQIIGGQRPTLPKNVAPDFIDYFDRFLASNEAQQLDPEILQVLQTLRDQVAQQPPAA